MFYWRHKSEWIRVYTRRRGVGEGGLTEDTAEFTENEQQLRGIYVSWTETGNKNTVERTHDGASKPVASTHYMDRQLVGGDDEIKERRPTIPHSPSKEELDEKSGQSLECVISDMARGRKRENDGR